MPDGGTRIETETLRSHIRHAELEMIEINRQIAERDRFGIPTHGLLAALSETIAARDTLRARLRTFEEA
jgi:hypothetical protein